MLTFILRRILYSIPVLVATSFLIFTFVSVSGDPLGRLRANPNITAEQIHSIEHSKNLDKPVIVRYGYWIRDAVTKQFGTTLFGNRKIWPDLKRVMGHTLQFILTALIISVIVGIAIGVYSGLRQYSMFDYTATTLSFVGFATPVFWLALMLQVLVVQIYLKWNIRVFYTSGLSSPTNAGHGLHFLLDRAQHLALPVIALCVLSIATYSRYMRASMLEVLNSDYVRTARAKGLVERRVIMKHAFRNALIPLITVVAIDFGAIFAGAIVTETIFTLDGMGFYFINALFASDPYPVMAWLMVVATMVIVFNLIADILYGVFDPRIRYD
jgi:ABC-type dipeptide/oligopeptide/nickel transport system permease component